jgi:hypothetical protein
MISPTIEIISYNSVVTKVMPVLGSDTTQL